MAAPAYLGRHGAPKTLEDLASHRHILFRMPGSGRDRPQQFGAEGRAVERQPAQGLRFNDGEAMVQAALHGLGLGLAQVPDNVVDDLIAAGQLTELLPQHRPPPMPIDAVMPAQRMVPARVRVLLEALGGLQVERRREPAAPGLPPAR